MAIARLGHSRLNGRVWSCRSNPDAKREFGAASTEANARAAPATVSGEPLFKQPLPNHWGEGEQGHRPASQETCQARNEIPAVGCGGTGGQEMTTKTLKATATNTGILSAVFAMFLGLGIITLAGHVQASALHDAAHDVRHATGFPCH